MQESVKLCGEGHASKAKEHLFSNLAELVQQVHVYVPNKVLRAGQKRVPSPCLNGHNAAMRDLNVSALMRSCVATSPP